MSVRQLTSWLPAALFGLGLAAAGCTASALGLLTIEQQMEEIIVIPACGFALAFDSCFDGFVLAQE